MSEVSFKIDVFEGPLDLLLSLIAHHKLSIWDVPLAEITDQYLYYLHEMEQSDIELSSEFLVVAAELLYIKSKSLLPQEQEETIEEDPEQSLKERLYQYSLIKAAKEYLLQEEFNGKYLFVKMPEPIKFPPAPLGAQSTDRLISALLNIADRHEALKPVEKKEFSGVVAKKPVSIFSKVKDILRKIRKKAVKYKELFTGTRSERVASFLAVLELLKLNRIDIKESGDELIIINNDRGADNE